MTTVDHSKENDGTAATAVRGVANPQPRPAHGNAPPSLPPLTLGGAMGRHPFLLVLPVVLLVGAAIGIGLNRAPTYTAETRLGVGRLDVPSQSIPGIVSANQSLAATYSRIVKAEGVLDPVAARVGLSPDEVDRALHASPIPDSPIIRIEATAKNAAQAMRMADLTGTVLIRYVEKVNQAGDGDGLIQQYRDAASALAAAQLARDEAQRMESRSSSEETRQTLSEATADYEVANIRFTTLRDQISQDAQGQASTDTITTLNTASEAVSDYEPMLQRLVALGLIAGLAFGVVLALMRERFKRRAAPA